GITDLSWSSDGATLLFVGTVAMKGQSSNAIWALPACGGEPRRLALGEESCAAELQQPPGADRAAVSVGKGLETLVYWLDPATGALAPIFPGAEIDSGTDVLSWTVRQVEGGA